MIVSTLLKALPFAATLLPVNAAVEAVQIRIQGGNGKTIYAVPAGKVLVIEHIMFSDRWDLHDEEKRVVIRHGGANTTGTVWNTTQKYSSNWNQLMRPLRLPAGKAIACPYLDDSLYMIFLYGKLVDEGDLFAAIDTEIKDVGTKVEGNTKTLLGTVDLASKRPAQIKLEESSDLKTWDALDDVPQITNQSLAFMASSEKPKLFVRAKARALPEEEIVRQSLAMILPPIMAGP